MPKQKTKRPSGGGGLGKQLVSIPFGQGLDSKIDPKALPVGKLEVLENGVIDKAGHISKRTGTTTIAAIPGSDKASSIFSFENEILIRQNSNKYVRKYIKTTDTWSKDEFTEDEGPLIGQLPWIETKLYSATSGSEVQELSPSMTVSADGKFACVVWVARAFDSASKKYHYEYWYSVLDITIGTITQSFRIDDPNDSGSTTRAATITKVAVAPYSSADFYAYYEYYDGSAPLWSIKRRKITTADAWPQAVAQVVVADTVYEQTDVNRSFDVVVHSESNSTKHHLVYTKDASGTNTVEYALQTGDTVSLSETHSYSLTDNTLYDVTVNVFTADSVSRIFVSYFEQDGSGNVKAVVREQLESDPDATATHYLMQTGTITTTTTYAHSSTCLNDDGDVGLVISYEETTGGAAYASKVKLFQFPPGASKTIHLTDDLDAYMNNVRAVTRAFNLGGEVLVGLTTHYDSALTIPFTSVSFVRMGPRATTSDTSAADSRNNYQCQIYGRTLVNGYHDTFDNGRASEVVVVGAKFYTAIAMATNLQSWVNSAGNMDSLTNSRIQLLEVDTAEPSQKAQVSRATIGKNLFIAHGMLSSYDGNVVKDHGFPYRPALSAARTSGGNLDASSSYDYVAVFEWEDAQGNLHQSEPSDSVTVTTDGAGNQTFNLSVANIRNPTNLSSWHSGNYKRIDCHLYRTQGNGTVFNRIGSIEMTAVSAAGLYRSWQDGISDTVAALGKLLYTDGDVFADVTPPACRYVVAHRNRLFLIAEDNRIWFSKIVQEGFGVAFSDAFVIEMEGKDDDRPVALASYGNLLIILRERSIWSISGEGPSNTGVGGFYEPRRISAVVGASDRTPTAVVDSREEVSGVVFQSPRGIHITDGQKVQYMGGPVEEELGSDSVISIDVDQLSETVRFLLGTKVLVYNYRYNQWGVFTYAGLSSDNFNDAVSVDNVYYLATDGSSNIWKEDSSYYDLTSTYIPLKMRTAWVRLDAVQGFMRSYLFHVLGDSKNAHDMTVSVRYDYGSTIADTYSLVSTETSSALLQFRGFLSKQKCQAIQFELEDAVHANTNTGQGYIINEIQLTVGSKRGGFRLPETGSTVGSDS